MKVNYHDVEEKKKRDCRHKVIQFSVETKEADFPLLVKESLCSHHLWHRSQKSLGNFHLNHRRSGVDPPR